MSSRITHTFFFFHLHRRQRLYNEISTPFGDFLRDYLALLWKRGLTLF